MTSGGDSARPGSLTRRQRVDHALMGAEVDRPPFTFWHHFRLDSGERHAAATLDFHRRLRTDLVKVMSDFPFPRPAGNWYELRVEENPYPEQIRALEIIRDGLAGQAHFVETIFNPWNVAEKLSSPAEVKQLMAERGLAHSFQYHPVEWFAELGVLRPCQDSLLGIGHRQKDPGRAQ